MPQLVALDLPGSQGFVDELRRIWDGGDAVLPVDQRLPHAAKLELIERMGAARVVSGEGSAPTTSGRPTDEGDGAVLATSGSTGEPKGVVLTHEAIAASAEATSKRLGVRPDDHWLACLPLSHIGGLSVVFRALLSGTGLTVHPSFDAAAAEQSGATLVSLVSTALRRIDPTVFRVIVLGGSRPPEDRPENSVTTYGMTETGSGVVYDRRPLDGVEMRIVDDEIQVRGSMLLRCYRDGTDPKQQDGWFPTGDLGAIDADGLLTVHGRRGDLIITGGENVWPDPVEAALRTHPAVSDAAIYGRDDPEWGQVVTAAIVPTHASAPPTLGALREHVKGTLPAFCAPRRLVTCSEVPRTTLGKIKRAELAQLDR